MTNDNTEDWKGGAELVNDIPLGFHTRSEAAKLCGRSYDTLRTWHREGVYEPSAFKEAGQLTIWLYTDEDIENMKQIATSMKRGRKKQPPQDIDDIEGGLRDDPSSGHDGSDMRLVRSAADGRRTRGDQDVHVA